MSEQIIDSFDGDYRWLSNFYYAPVSYGSLVFATNEHAYQAMKSKDPKYRLMVACQATPGAAKRAGKSVYLRPDWEQIKDEVMLHFTRKKYDTHPDLVAKLLATGEAILIEGNTWNDTYWGVCRGVGLNKLGLTIMKVRNELKAK